MSIAMICDGCDVRVVQAGPNTGPVALPLGWAQFAIERKNEATLVQHQCPRCFADIQRRMREQHEANTVRPALQEKK